MDSNTSSTDKDSSTESSTTDTKTPDRLKNKTMQEIINTWHRDLESDMKSFKQQANLIEQWDTQIRANGKNILNLYRDVTLVQAAQKELNTNLDLVASHQTELDNTLKTLETSVNKLYDADPNIKNNFVDVQRTKTADLAISVSGQLQQLVADLDDMTLRISAHQSRSEESNDPIAKIFSNVNSQFAQLQWISKNVSMMNAKLSSLETEKSLK